MRRITSLITTTIFIINCSLLQGQSSDSKSGETINQAVKVNYTSVFFQTDRTYYLSGESIFFKAIIPDRQNNKPVSEKDTLHMIMLDQFGLKISSLSMPVYNNIISGNIALPDMLTEGNYILVSYLSSMKNVSPENFFSKIIEIRKSPGYLLFTALSLDDTSYDSGNQMIVQLKFTDNDNNPVPAVFSYQLLGRKEEIISGNNKANGEGNAILKLQLPKFDSKEELELIVNPSYKSLKSITGVIIPTQYNRTDTQLYKANHTTSSELRHLNIRINSGNLIFGKNDNIQLEISVTDDIGAPAIANLSVSAAIIAPVRYPIENETIASFLNRQGYLTTSDQDIEIREYFTQFLIEKTQTPGRPFIIQEKNNAKKLLRKKEVNPPKPMSSTLFWEPEILTGNTGKATVHFTNNGNLHEVLVTVEGFAADGTSGTSYIRYSVK